jgi:hypothetical protein
MKPPAFISNVSRIALALLGTISAVAAIAGTAA